MSEADRRPDGIGAEHARTTSRGGHANPLGLIVLGAAMLAAMLGFAGYEVDRTASGNGASVAWHAPEVIRNGEFLEMRMTVEATESIERLVLGIDTALLEDFTINTMIPAAAEEVSQDGEFRFDFGALESGHSLLVKVDAQIYPDALGTNAGTSSEPPRRRPRAGRVHRADLQVAGISRNVQLRPEQVLAVPGHRHDISVRQPDFDRLPVVRHVRRAVVLDAGTDRQRAGQPEMAPLSAASATPVPRDRSWPS